MKSQNQLLIMKKFTKKIFSASQAVNLHVHLLENRFLKKNKKEWMDSKECIIYFNIANLQQIFSIKFSFQREKIVLQNKSEKERVLFQILLQYKNKKVNHSQYLKEGFRKRDKV